MTSRRATAALLLAAAAGAVGSSAHTYVLGPSAARVALNGALHRALGCDGRSGGELSTLAAEQCALTDFDTPDLHGVFRQRRVLHGASGSAVTTIITTDSPAALRVAATALRDEQRKAGGSASVVALVPAAWAAAEDAGGVQQLVDRVWALPADGSPAAAVEFVSAQLADAAAEEAAAAKERDGARAERQLEGATKPAGALKKQAGVKSVGGAAGVAAAAAAPGEGSGKPAPTWQAWLQLSTRTQLAALIALALAAIALHKLAWYALDECEKALAAATQAASALEGSAGDGKLSSARLATARSGAVADAEAGAGGAGSAGVSSSSSSSSGGAAAAAGELVLVSGGAAALATTGATAASGAGGAAGGDAAPSPAELAKAAGELRGAWLRTALVTGGLLAFLTLVNVVFDRWRLFPLLDKQREAGTDIFWAAMTAAFLLACYLGVGVSERDGDVLMGVRQTEEAKGWMMLGFLVYHWWDVKSTYNLIRVLVSAYVFLTGYGNTVSLSSKPPTLAKYASSFLRINLLVTCVSLAMGQDYMLYYICGLHTFWTAYVYLLHATLGGGSGGVTRVPKVYRYALAIGANAVLWHWPALFNLVFAPLSPLLTYNGSMYEWYFRSKLDCFICIVGCLLAEAREPIMRHLKVTDTYTMLAVRLTVGGAVLGLHATQLLAIGDRKVYNVYHPYTSFVPILGFVFLRNASSSLRKGFSGVFAAMGRHSLEIYLMQFHVWLGTLAKTNVTLVPSMRAVSTLGQTVIFLFLAGVAFRACNAANALLNRKQSTALAAMAVSAVLLMLAPRLWPM